LRDSKGALPFGGVWGSAPQKTQKGNKTNMAKHRQQKVAHELLRTLSTALMEDVKDPRVSMVSLTDVSVSADLSVASVRWLCPKDEDKKEIMSGLVKATPFLRSLIADRLALRRVPMLNFYYDDAYENGQKISDLLAQLRASGQMGEE
jgi:ribosome-binding factor A